MPGWQAVLATGSGLGIWIARTLPSCLQAAASWKPSLFAAGFLTGFASTVPLIFIYPGMA